MTLCLTCRNEDSCVETDIRKIRGECEYYKPITNADRIRSMTDDELLEFIQMVYGNGRAGLSPTNGWKEWLNKPTSFDESEEGE